MDEKAGMDIYDLYDAASAISVTEEREQFIRGQCGSDHELLEKLHQLLNVKTQAEEFFEAIEQPSKERKNDREILSSELGGLGKVGKFHLLRLVGRGGMGNVFLAYDQQLNRHVALKFPKLDTVNNPEILERFLHEARLAAQLNHPNLVKIYQVEVYGDTCFIASEWCEGGDLAHWLRQHPGPQDPIWTARFLGDIARSLAYCHQQKIVHLDIKPANIILNSRSTEEQPEHILPSDREVDDSKPSNVSPQKINDWSNAPANSFRPMLTDFGVAKIIEEGLIASHSSLLMGTPLYMAPEQAEGDRSKIGPTSDIFAIGIVLFEMLYGKRPFDGDSPLQIMDQLRRADTLVIPRKSSVPIELRTICERCVQKSPEDRYPSADALAEDLDRFLRGEPIHAHSVSVAQQLRRWCGRPQRIVEAVTAMICFQVVLTLWTLLGLVATGYFSDGPDLLSSRVQLAMTILMIPLPLIVLAYLTARGNSWPIYMACIIILFGQVCVPIAAMLNVIDIMGHLYANQPFFKLVNLALVLFCGVTQLLMLGMAILADRKMK